MASPNILEKLRELIAQEQKVNKLLEAWYANPLYGTPNGGQSAECRLVQQHSAELYESTEAFKQLCLKNSVKSGILISSEASLAEQLKYYEFTHAMDHFTPSRTSILVTLAGKVESLEKEVVQEKEERQKVENECMKKMEVLMAEVNSLKAELHVLKTKPQTLRNAEPGLDEVKPTFFQKLRSIF